MKKLISMVIFILLITIPHLAFGNPGMKITEPLDGTIVVPEEEITVKIEAVEGFEIRQGVVSIALGIISGIFSDEKTAGHFFKLPETFIFKIRKDTVGEIPIIVFGRDKSGKTAGDNIKIICQPQATIKALKLNDGETSVDVEVDWNDNIKNYYPNFIFSVKGIYSDGVEREITKVGIPITYESSDPSVASIDIKGKIVVHKVGNAQIIVSSSGVSNSMPIVFKQPAGTRPSETIPPITQIDIQPPANEAGWHNSDVTITITAQDNEGGSGFKEIRYIWFDSSEYEFVPYNEVVLTVSKEGENGLVYYAVDNELNKDFSHRIEFKLDKTPPVITFKLSPQPASNGWNNMDVAVNFAAADTFSGVKTVTQPSMISQEGKGQIITGEAIDFADNKAVASTFVSIDKTPPEVTINVPIDGAEYTLNKSIFAGWFVNDALSGTASADGTVPNGGLINTSVIGPRTFSVVAIDNAGNKKEKVITYYVRYSYSEVMPPINKDGSSMFKLGRTVPVKFSLKDEAGNFISTAAARIYLAKIDDTITGTEIEADSTSEATSGNLFRYSSADNQYIFNLGTKGLSGGTWQIRIFLDDGSSKYVTISLK